jgi:hypothetical protein
MSRWLAPLAGGFRAWLKLGYPVASLTPLVTAG